MSSVTMESTAALSRSSSTTSFDFVEEEKLDVMSIGAEEVEQEVDPKEKINVTEEDLEFVDESSDEESSSWETESEFEESNEEIEKVGDVEVAEVESDGNEKEGEAEKVEDHVAEETGSEEESEQKEDVKEQEQENEEPVIQEKPAEVTVVEKPPVRLLEELYLITEETAGEAMEKLRDGELPLLCPRAMLTTVSKLYQDKNSGDERIARLNLKLFRLRASAEHAANEYQKGMESLREALRLAEKEKQQAAAKLAEQNEKMNEMEKSQLEENRKLESKVEVAEKRATELTEKLKDLQKKLDEEFIKSFEGSWRLTSFEEANESMKKLNTPFFERLQTLLSTKNYLFEKRQNIHSWNQLFAYTFNEGDLQLGSGSVYNKPECSHSTKIDGETLVTNYYGPDDGFLAETIRYKRNGRLYTVINSADGTVTTRVYKRVTSRTDFLRTCVNVGLFFAGRK